MTTWQDFFSTQPVAQIHDWIAYTRKQGIPVYPQDGQIFRAFDLTPLDQVKVVIIGQDPYFNGQADGLAFSVSGTKTTIPVSLQRIIAELKDDGFTVAPTWRGSLEQWARQGVLLLNTSLTVLHDTPGSHMANWQRFVGDALRFVVCERRPHFVLWGSPAKALMFNAIGTDMAAWDAKMSDLSALSPSNPFPTFTHSAHPAARTATPNPMKGSRPFSRANKVLKWRGLAPIDWSLA